MEKMLINERFKSPNKEFEKVYAIFDKRDYFNNKGLAKTQIGNFKRALEKNDKGAQKLLDAHKGNMDSAISYIEEFISDGNKRKSFESFQEFSSMVNALEMSTKPNLKQKPAEFIKRRIHNNSQKYTIALYSAIRKQKFNNYKDVHKDVDELVSKNESVNEGKKRFKRQDGIGKAKYTISFHDGKKKHKDGSDFFDIKIFKNKKDLSDFVGTLAKQGYKLTRESVNEADITVGGKEYNLKKSGSKITLINKKLSADKFIFRNTKEFKDWADDQVDPIGGTQSSHFGINEASKLAMGIAGFTGTRGSAVDAFIDSHKIDAKKLFNFVKKGNLKDRMAFVSAIAGKPNNKMFKMITKQFSESTPQGYNPMVEDKSEITKLVKKVNNSETKFYDVLSVMEKKYGKNKYRIWLEKSLKDFGVNPKHYDYRTNAAVEEKLFQLGK
jgi:hypothetical protein